MKKKRSLDFFQNLVARCIREPSEYIVLMLLLLRLWLLLLLKMMRHRLSWNQLGQQRAEVSLLFGFSGLHASIQAVDSLLRLLLL